MPASTEAWWTLLRAVSVFNVLAWSLAALWLLNRQSTLHQASWQSRRLQLFLSAGYVFGCAYRSLLPVYDVQRLCLVDSWLSSVMVGRTVATLAEMCFATQWALLLSQAARDARSRFAAATARIILPAIALAELCSWYSVLTTSNLGHVVEESLWGLCALLLVASLAVMAPRVELRQRALYAFLGVAGAAYAMYMFAIDVPMYWARWIADEAQGRAYLSVLQGAVDVSSRWVVSHHWDDWKSEVVWMSMYFSLAVWLSIALVHLPRQAASDATR